MFRFDTGELANDNRPASAAPSRYVVTGGAGFIGAHLVEVLLASSPAAKVTVFDAFTYAARVSSLMPAFETGRLAIVRGRIEDETALRPHLDNETIVLNLAAESHVPRSFADPGLFDRVNRLGTRRVLAAALSAGVRRVLHFSTDEVYGSRLTAAAEDAPFAPTTPYARSKAAAEGEVLAFRERGLAITVVRPSNVIGTRQNREKLFPAFVSRALDGLPLSIEGSGLQRRTFIDVGDIARAVRIILDRGETNGTYNIEGFETLTVRDVAALVAETLGLPVSLERVADRPVNDQAYMIDGSRLAALGFRPRIPIRQSVLDIAAALTADRSRRAGTRPGADVRIRDREGAAR